MHNENTKNISMEHKNSNVLTIICYIMYYYYEAKLIKKFSAFTLEKLF